MDALARWYYFANTPAYLYRHYRENCSVQEFADENSISGLIETVLEITAIDTSTRTINQVVIAYAALVGLTFKNVREVRESLRGKDLDSLVWAQRILNLWSPYPTISETMEISSPLPNMVETVLSTPQPSSRLNTITAKIGQ